MKSAPAIFAFAFVLLSAPFASASADDVVNSPGDRLFDLDGLLAWLGMRGGEDLPVLVTVREAETVVPEVRTIAEPRFTLFEKDEPRSPREDAPTREPSQDRESSRDALHPSADAARIVEAVHEIPGPATHPIVRVLDALTAAANDLGRILGLTPADSEPAVETATMPVDDAPARETSGAAVREAAVLAGLAVVAVAGAAAAGAQASGLRRLLGLLAFTRIGKDDVLGHAVRETLYARIKERPGLSLNDLVKAAAVGRTAVQYHLVVLEREGLVSSRRVGRVRVYRAAGERVDEQAAAVLDHETTRNMARAVVGEPGVDQRGLASRLAISASLAHWHLARLERANVVRKVRDGRRVRYYPADGFAALAHLVQ